MDRLQEPNPASSVEKEDLRQVMGRYATGAAIVTGSWKGRLYGMTVNSFTSVSLSPPIILFCPDKRSETWPPIWKSRHFAVNILGCDHGELCRRFAKKGEDRFDGIDCVSAANGSPLLHDAVAFLECEVYRVHDGGDHFVTLGRVHDMGVRGESPPLVFYRGAYHQLAGVTQPQTD